MAMHIYRDIKRDLAGDIFPRDSPPCMVKTIIIWYNLFGLILCPKSEDRSLLEWQKSSTSTSPASTSNESFAAATALMALSKSNVSNDDNFSLKDMSKTQVRTCYGCGKMIRTPPALPLPPHDLCIVRKEYRSFRNGEGELKVSDQPQNCHYHLRVSCIKKKHRDFVSSMLNIPDSLKFKLTAIHWDWLDKEFNIFSSCRTQSI